MKNQINDKEKISDKLESNEKEKIEEVLRRLFSGWMIIKMLKKKIMMKA